MPSAKWAYKILSASAEIFCRHSFGSRYIGNLILGFLSCCIYLAVTGLTDSGNGISGCYLVAYFSLLLYHAFSAFFRQGQHVHSESNGVPWDIWRLTPDQVNGFQMFAEPSCFFVIGLIIAHWDGSLGAWLLGCAICHFIKGLIRSWDQRTRLLDALDARLEGEHMSNAVREHQSPSQERSSTVVAAQHQRLGANTVRDIKSNLDPALRDLMNTPAHPEVKRYHAGPLGTLPRIRAGQKL